MRKSRKWILMHHCHREANKRNTTGSGSFLLGLLSLLATAACGSSDETGREDSPLSEYESDEMPTENTEFPAEMLPAELVDNLPLVAPESDLDIALFSDIVDIAPGDDVTFCTYTDVILDEPTIFGETFGAQSPTGHHAILQYATAPQEPHTGACGEGMSAQIMLGGTGGKAVKDEPTLPTNFGIEVPAGAQLVINHHWINATEHSVDGQSMLLARRLARGGDTVMAGSFPMLGFGWEIPAQSELEYTTECTYEEDVEYVLALGHMHEWGEHVRIEVERSGGAVETLVDQPWTAEDATSADGGTIFSLEEPYVVHKGDTVRLTCNWQNDTAEAIGFPREMCIFFGYTIGSNHFCANGTWMTPSDAAAMGGQEVIDHL